MKEFIRLFCLRCNHDWVRRRKTNPKVCPECKRSNWNIGGCAYVLRECGGVHKIGYSDDIYNRYPADEARASIIFRILTREVSGMVAETMLHKIFANKRKGQSEHFRLEEKDLRLIERFAKSNSPIRDMSKMETTIFPMAFKCSHCSHNWDSRKSKSPPKACPKCKQYGTAKEVKK